MDKHNLGIKGANLASVLILFDQLLLPMLHLGVPFKLSYLLLLLWPAFWLLSQSSNPSRVGLAEPIPSLTLLLVMVTFGEWYFRLYFTPADNGPYVKVAAIYILCICAFGVGSASRRFEFNSIIVAFFGVAFLNAIFILVNTKLPGFVIDFYYPERVLIDREGFRSTEEILSLSRPRGFAGNPNVSMVLTNVAFLFVYLSVKHRVLQLRRMTLVLALTFIPIVLSILLQSRSGFLVAVFQASLFLFLQRRNFNFKLRKFVWPTTFITCCSLAFALKTFEIDLSRSIARLATIVTQAFDFSADSAENIVRPIMTLDVFVDRFLLSPLFGSGVSASSEQTFSDGTMYFHNDWFHLLASSGLLGSLLFAFVLWKIARHLGLAVLIPFVIPGMTNTFLLNIPAMISYFLVMGILVTSIKVGGSAATPHQLVERGG